MRSTERAWIVYFASSYTSWPGLGPRRVPCMIIDSPSARRFQRLAQSDDEAIGWAEHLYIGGRGHAIPILVALGRRS